jgi:Flp pilus assembly secretin CpaC
MSQLSVRRLEASRASFRRVSIVCLALAVSVVAAKGADLIGVTLDQAKVLQLPDKTATVIVGNPSVADVTMLKKNNTIVLTGKSFGETNLIALDGQGKALGESIVRVTAADDTLVVQRGSEKRESYTCAPRCQPVISLGDTTQYLSDVKGNIESRNSLQK